MLYPNANAGAIYSNKPVHHSTLACSTSFHVIHHPLKVFCQNYRPSTCFFSPQGFQPFICSRFSMYSSQPETPGLIEQGEEGAGDVGPALPLPALHGGHHPRPLLLCQPFPSLLLPMCCRRSMELPGRKLFLLQQSKQRSHLLVSQGSKC